MKEIRHILCVASGKGGVGKSTTAVNLALALAGGGERVGLLDADIYGPSLPLMLGIEAGSRPEIRDKKYMVPVAAHGVVCNSMGLLVEARTAMVWRAPMIISAFNQILRDTLWGPLDFLIVDMPPGTGDIQLSLAQTVSLAGAVIVTTPQDVALLDARKGIEMFGKVGVPVLGVVENMSTHICSQCGHEEPIFGEGGGDRLAAEYQVEVIGRLPLDILVRSRTDGGRPVVVSEPDSTAAAAYRALADNVRRGLTGRQEADEAAKPEIIISDD